MNNENINGKELIQVFLSEEVKNKAIQLFNSQEDSLSFNKLDFSFQFRKVNNEHINFGFLKIGKTLRFVIIGFISLKEEFTIMPQFTDDFEKLNFSKKNFKLKYLDLYETLFIVAFSYEAYLYALKERDLKIGLFGQPLEFFITNDGDINVFFFDFQIGCYYIKTSKGIGFNNEKHSLAVDLGNKKLFSCLNPF